MRKYFALEAESWKGRAGTAAGCDEKVERLHGEFARRVADRNALFLPRTEIKRRNDCDVSEHYGEPLNHRLENVLRRKFRQIFAGKSAFYRSFERVYAKRFAGTRPAQSRDLQQKYVGERILRAFRALRFSARYRRFATLAVEIFRDRASAPV